MQEHAQAEFWNQNMEGNKRDEENYPLNGFLRVRTILYRTVTIFLNGPNTSYHYFLSSFSSLRYKDYISMIKLSKIQ
jgi:hypothetical protein